MLWSKEVIMLQNAVLISNKIEIFCFKNFKQTIRKMKVVSYKALTIFLLHRPERN